MATLRDIRARISGVKSTQKITKAMKMVSAAKLRRAQDAIIATRPYAGKLRELLQYLSGIVDVTQFPQFEDRPVNRVAVVIVAGDRGLCGAFNSNLFRVAVHHLNANYASLMAEGKVDIITVGRKSSEFFGKRNYNVVSRYSGIFSGLQFSVAHTIADEVTRGFLNGTYDKVEVIYNEFKSIAQQHTTVEQVLPITTLDAKGDAGAAKKAAVDYIYEPTSTEIVKALVPKHLDFLFWRVVLESNAAEQGARMRAMDNATNNANDMIRSLQLSYNKARQASITKELLEIVSGAEALKAAS